jgi:hypothetical protein
MRRPETKRDPRDTFLKVIDFYFCRLKMYFVTFFRVSLLLFVPLECFRANGFLTILCFAFVAVLH